MVDTFVHLGLGNRIRSLLGFDTPREVNLLAHDYRFVRMKFGEAENPASEEITSVAKRGNRLRLHGKQPLQLREYRAIIELNPVLYQYADVTASHIVEPGDDLHIYARFFRDCDLGELEYLYTLYLVA